MAEPPVQRTRSGKTVRWDDKNLTKVASSGDGGAGHHLVKHAQSAPGEQQLDSTHHEQRPKDAGDSTDMTKVSSDSWKRFDDIDDEDENKYWARLKRRESESHIHYVDNILFGNAATHRAGSRLMRLASDPKLVDPPQPDSISSELISNRGRSSFSQAPPNSITTASDFKKTMLVDTGTNTESTTATSFESETVRSNESRPRRGSTNPPMIVNAYPALGHLRRRNSDSRLPASGRVTSPAVFQRDLFLFSPVQSTTHLPTQRKREDKNDRSDGNDDDDSLLRSGSESELARLEDSDVSSVNSFSVPGRKPAPPPPPQVRQPLLTNLAQGSVGQLLEEGKGRGENPLPQGQTSGNPKQLSQSSRQGQLHSQRRLSVESGDYTGLFKPTHQHFPKVMHPSSTTAAATSENSHPVSTVGETKAVSAAQMPTVDTAAQTSTQVDPFTVPSSASVCNTSTNGDTRVGGSQSSSRPNKAGAAPDKFGIDSAGPSGAAALDNVNTVTTTDPPSPRGRPPPPESSSNGSRQPPAEPDTRKRVRKGAGEARNHNTPAPPRPPPGSDVSQSSARAITTMTKGDKQSPEVRAQQISGSLAPAAEGKSDRKETQVQGQSGGHLPHNGDAPPKQAGKGKELLQQQRRYSPDAQDGEQSKDSEGTTAEAPLSVEDRDTRRHEKAGVSTDGELLHTRTTTSPDRDGRTEVRRKPDVTPPGVTPLKSGTMKGAEKGDGVEYVKRGAAQRQAGDSTVSNNDRHPQRGNVSAALAQSQPESKHAGERAHRYNHSGVKNTPPGTGPPVAEYRQFSRAREGDGVTHGLEDDTRNRQGHGTKSVSHARADDVRPDHRRQPLGNHPRQKPRTRGEGTGGGNPQNKFLRETTPVSLHSKAYLSESLDTFRKQMSQDFDEADSIPDDVESPPGDWDSDESMDDDVMRKSLRALSAKIQLQKIEAEFSKLARNRSATSEHSGSDNPAPLSSAAPPPARKMSGSRIPAPVGSEVARSRGGGEREDVTLPKISNRGEAGREDRRGVEGGPSYGYSQRMGGGQPSLQGDGDPDVDWKAEVEIHEEYAGGDTYVFYLQTDEGELVGPLRFDVEGIDLGLPGPSQPHRSNSETDGLRNRQTGSHGLNEFSSRSHSVLTVTIDSETQPDTEDENLYVTKRGKLSFVDLAGSEKVKDASGGFGGPGMLESNSINKSLLVLGNCISHLGDARRRQGHIPYRDSKLTKLLSDSLAGNGITLMIACITPSSSNITETMNTLRYASRAKKIKSKPTVKMDPREKLIMNLKREIKVLRNENHYLRQQLDFPAKPKGQLQKENDEKFMKFMKEQKEKESGLYEMLQEYMVENESLRAENSEMHSMRDRIRREQQLLYRENEKLMKRVEEMEKVMMQNPGMWAAKQNRTDGYGQYDLTSPRGSPVAGGYQSGHKQPPAPVGMASPPASRGKVPGPMRPPHRLPDPVMRPAQRPVELIELENGGVHPGNNGFVSPRAGPRQTSPSRQMERGPSQASATDAIHNMNEQLKKEVLQLEGQIRHHQYVHERTGDLSRSNGHSVR